MRQLEVLLSFWPTIPYRAISEEVNMGERVNLQSRRELLKQFAPQYREASLPRNACYWIPLPRSRAIIVAIACG